jgi:hypothetical protein
MSRAVHASESLSVPAWHVMGKPLPFHDRAEEVNMTLSGLHYGSPCPKMELPGSLARVKPNSYLRVRRFGCCY